MSTEPTVQTASEPAVACTDLLARGTPIADAEKEEAAVQGGWMYVIPFETGQAIEREKTFYRGLLEQLCQDPRKTRARRLAESGLMFWESMQAEKRKRANARLRHAGPQTFVLKQQREPGVA